MFVLPRLCTKARSVVICLGHPLTEPTSMQWQPRQWNKSIMRVLDVAMLLLLAILVLTE
jgi:hypothetical protein